MDIELKIIRRADGNVEVSGPLTDAVLCYGMMEAAKDAIREFKARAQRRSEIHIPALSPEAIRKVNGRG